MRLGLGWARLGLIVLLFTLPMLIFGVGAATVFNEGYAPRRIGARLVQGPQKLLMAT